MQNELNRATERGAARSKLQKELKILFSLFYLNAQHKNAGTKARVDITYESHRARESRDAFEKDENNNELIEELRKISRARNRNLNALQLKHFFKSSGMR